MSDPNQIRDVNELALAVQDQPGLFDFVVDAPVVSAAREIGHTGRWTMQHGETVAKIVALWFEHSSMRRVARELGVSRNTVSAVIQRLEEAGKLEPLKKRFERARLELGMEQMAWLGELIEDRDKSIEAAQIIKAGWVGVGIVSDKEMAAPQVVVNVHAGLATSDRQVDDYVRMLAQAGAVDVQSEVPPPNLLPPNGAASLDTAEATSGPAALPSDQVPDASPDQDPEQGAGGVAEPEGGQT